MESIHLYLYDFTKNVVLSHVTPTLSLDELHLPSLTPGAAAGVARRTKGEGGGTLGYAGMYDYWVGNDLSTTSGGTSSGLNGDSSSGSDSESGGGYLMASRGVGGGSKSHKASSVLEGRLSTSAGRFGLYMSLAPLALSSAHVTDGSKQQQQGPSQAVDHSLIGGGVFKFNKHFCGKTLFMGNSQDTRVKKVSIPDNTYNNIGSGGGSSWANSFAAATASASPLNYLNFTPPSTNGGVAAPTTADLLVTFQVGTLGGNPNRPANLQFDPFAVNGGGLVPQSMIGMCTRNVATHASTSGVDIPLVAAWSSRAYDGVGSSSGVAGWMFDIVTGALYTLHCTPNRHTTIALVSKVENYCDVTCVTVQGDSNNVSSSQAPSVVGTGDNRTTTYNVHQASSLSNKKTPQRQLCPPVTMHVSLPIGGLGAGYDTSDMLTTATLTVICKGRTVHSTTLQTTRMLLEGMMPCAQVYDDATTVELW
jgi:hypothetical protein